VYADARLALPRVKPIRLSFATAIRDHTEKEPPSDGVEWRVYVSDGAGFQEVFRRFSKAKTWEPAEVDLSAYAGKRVTLRLWNGPGPENNTTCDSGYWAEPALLAGAPFPVEPAAARRERERVAVARARKALRGEHAPLAWRLQSGAGLFGAALVPGPHGLPDAALAITTTSGIPLLFNGFLVSVGDEELSHPRSQAAVTAVKVSTSGARSILRHTVSLRGKPLPVEVTVWAEGGGLRIAFAMPGVKRDRRGEPRFTLLGLGSANRGALRVYAGFGNVIQAPRAFTLTAGGFNLSTRHVGTDFDNGISLVQASNVFPDRFEVDPARKLYSLQTHHDATLLLVPSAKGAFAAARVYRDLSGFHPAPGVAKLQGRMCIDWWGGHDIAADLRRAGAYGLNDSVFVKHNWQRWGYDYRLPDIYPPNCDPEVWNAWVTACKEAGMLCAVHDNYIDFYPDAEGFSYRHILFNADGTPQRAWYHRGYDAQSYRWLPHAFRPWLLRNLKLVKEGFAPTAYFIDVFTAIPLLDYYDEEGRFYTKMECAKHWGACFDTARQILGDNAPQISEAGHDGLIGHLDGGQSDHYSAAQWKWSGADAERTPWHDMASHGSFVLFAGGLGNRYAGDDPYANYGSDDYLSNTVMGGRNPMAGGPCTRVTVMTYWLLHDVCKELARQSLERHEFGPGNDIHRQHTTFGGGGEVWCNRGTSPWKVAGVVLPRFGFLARAGNAVASVTEREGLSVGYAHTPEATFVDARPVALDTAGKAPVKTRVLSARYLGGDRAECEIEWEVLEPLPPGYVMFTHFCHDQGSGGEKIAFQPPSDLSPELLRQPGVHRCTVRITFPADAPEGVYRLRYGLYTPTGGGGRLLPIAELDGTRVRGGTFTVTKRAGAITNVVYAPEEPGPAAARVNVEGKMVDFGPITTNGAFRLLHTGNTWKLLPLQGSLPFRAEIRLAPFGAADKRVVSVEGLDQQGNPRGSQRFIQEGGVLRLELDAKAFAYRIRLES
ncbi:MAG: hypothetical protein QHJ73_07750, partial [Armatimonadota bacterium]|nr:hypothetical protein [Armatimonadota bacterium]